MSRKLNRVGLPAENVKSLNDAKITNCQELLDLGSLQLMRCSGLNLYEAEQLRIKTSTVIAPKSCSAWEMLNKKPKPSFMQTSLTALDKVLRGGLPCGMVTEIVGPPGVGKTQFCLMFSTIATLPQSLGGLDGSVIYIDTESAFTMQRLSEIAVNRHPNHYRNESHYSSLLQNISVYNADSSNGLSEILDTLDELIITSKAQLVIVDSIASLVRREFDSSRQIERSSLLAKQAAKLKYLAVTFEIPIVVTNQITTRFTENEPVEESDVSSEEKDDEGCVTAALGNTWSHCVNTRLITQFVDSSTRQILVAKSPVAPPVFFNYKIQESGISLMDDGCMFEGTNPSLQKIQTRTNFS